MYTSQIITAEIKSQKGFFVGDPCYALTRSKVLPKSRTFSFDP